MTRTERFLWSAGFSYLNFALTIAVGLWLTRFLLAEIGTEAMGLWVQLLQLIAFLPLLDLGVLALLPREVAATTGGVGGWMVAATDGRLPTVIGRFARLVVWQLPVLAAAAIAGWYSIAQFEPSASGPLALILVAFTVFFPLRFGGAVLTGLQDARWLGLIQLAGFVMGAAATVALAMAGTGLYAVAGGWAANLLATTLLQWTRLWAAFRAVLPTRLPRMPLSDVRRMAASGGWASLSTAGVMLSSNTDVLAVGRFYSAAVVLQYAFTAKLTTVLAAQPAVLSTAVIPGLAQVRATGDAAITARVVTAYAQAMMLVSGWLSCLILMTNSGFVQWWVGPQYDLGAVTVGLLALSMTLRHWESCQGVALFVAGRERLVWAVSLIEGVTAAGAMVALAAWAGPTWVPAGPVIVSCVIALPVLLTAAQRSGTFPLRAQARALGWWVVWAAVGVVGIVILRQVWHPDGLFELLAAGLAVTVGYASLMLPHALRHEVGLYLRPRLAMLGVGRSARRAGRGAPTAEVNNV